MWRTVIRIHRPRPQSNKVQDTKTSIVSENILKKKKKKKNPRLVAASRSEALLLRDEVIETKNTLHRKIGKKYDFDCSMSYNFPIFL
jgi:hypothetical protein